MTIGTRRRAARSSRLAADLHDAQVRRRRPVRVHVEDPGQHRRHQRGDGDAVPRDERGQLLGAEARGECHRAPGDQAAGEDRQAADARDRHRQQPAVILLPAEVGGACCGRGEQGAARQHGGPRLAGRAGGQHDHCGAKRQRGGATLDGAQRGVALGLGELRMQQQYRPPLLEQRVQGDDGVDRTGAVEHVRHRPGRL
jgi:hypothetical protein